MSHATSRVLALFVFVCSVAVFACHREPDYEGRRLAEWFDSLASKNAATRAKAADIVAREAPDHPETLRRLLDALTVESDTSMHVVLAGALSAVVGRSGRGDEAIPALTSLAYDAHTSVRASAAMALARAVAVSTGPIPPRVDSALSALLRDTDHDMRAVGADAIASVAKSRPDAVARFTAAIGELATTDRIVWARLRALEAFILMQSPDTLALRVYSHTLRDDWPDMPRLSVQGLMRTPRVGAALADSMLPLLKSSDLLTRLLTIQALDSVAAAARSAKVRAALIALASDPDSSVQDAARRALARRPNR